jgi:hypothetical protein
MHLNKWQVLKIKTASGDAVFNNKAGLNARDYLHCHTYAWGQ